MIAPKSSRDSGFTLTEVMIAVAIIGIVAAIAYPSYTEHVKTVRRGDAVASLMSLANAMERHKTNNVGQGELDQRGYNGAALPDIHPNKSPIEGSDKYYDLVIEEVDATSYLIQAEPFGVHEDDECGILGLTHNGTKSASGSKSVSECWN